MNTSEYFPKLRNRLPEAAGADFFDELENRCESTTLQKGESLIRYQADNKMMFFIVSGSFIRNIITSRGEEKTVMFHTEDFNEFVKAYDTIYFHEKTNYEIKANERSTVLAFDFSYFFQHIQNDIHLLQYYTQRTEELLTTLDLFRNMQLSLTSEEYLEWLEENYRFLFQRFSAHNIASFMGITPIWLSKLRSRRIS